MLSPELVASYVEVANIFISIVIAIFGLSMWVRLKFSLQKKAIGFFLLGILLFALTEFLLVANLAWNSGAVESFKDLAKIVFIIVLGISLALFWQSERKEITRLRRRAFRDRLTGLYNYAYFTQAGEQKFLEAKRNQLPLSLMILDLDDFKAYNDNYGHEAGNAALRYFAMELKRITRTYDLVARYGGEEFVILVNSNIKEAYNLAHRICQGIAFSCTPQSHPELLRSITVSIGLSALTKSMSSLENLIEAADIELYRAKQTGKNRVYSVDR